MAWRASRLRASATLAAALALASCRGGIDPRPGSTDVRPVYDQASGRLRELAYDSDHDGRFEMTAFMDGRRVTRVEVDGNGDGRTDRWEYYDHATPAPTMAAGEGPALIRVELSTRHDCRVTRREGFRDGALAWAEDDRDGDGRIDRWETYAQGALTSLAVDTRGSGTADRRIIVGP